MDLDNLTGLFELAPEFEPALLPSPSLDLPDPPHMHRPPFLLLLPPYAPQPVTPLAHCKPRLVRILPEPEPEQPTQSTQPTQPTQSEPEPTQTQPTQPTQPQAELEPAEPEPEQEPEPQPAKQPARPVLSRKAKPAAAGKGGNPRRGDLLGWFLGRGAGHEQQLPDYPPFTRWSNVRLIFEDTDNRADAQANIPFDVYVGDVLYVAGATTRKKEMTVGGIFHRETEEARNLFFVTVDSRWHVTAINLNDQILEVPPVRKVSPTEKHERLHRAVAKWLAEPDEDEAGSPRAAQTNSEGTHDQPQSQDDKRSKKDERELNRLTKAKEKLEKHVKGLETELAAAQERQLTLEKERKSKTTELRRVNAKLAVSEKATETQRQRAEEAELELQLLRASVEKGAAEGGEDDNGDEDDDDEEEEREEEVAVQVAVKQKKRQMEEVAEEAEEEKVDRKNEAKQSGTKRRREVEAEDWLPLQKKQQLDPKAHGASQRARSRSRSPSGARSRHHRSRSSSREHKHSHKKKDKKKDKKDKKKKKKEKKKKKKKSKKKDKRQKSSSESSSSTSSSS